MNTSQSRASIAESATILRRVLVVIGSLFGLAFLAVLLSGTASASDKSPKPDDPGLLGGVVDTAAEHAMPLLESVERPVHRVASAAAPLVEEATKPVEPVLAPVVRPVAKVAEPVLKAVEPVTAPVTRPVLDALAPITRPVAQAAGADRVIEPVDSRMSPPEEVTAPESRPRADLAATSEMVSTLDVHSGPSGRREFAGPRSALVEQSSSERVLPAEISAGKVSGAGGGPSLPSGPGSIGVGGSTSMGSTGSPGPQYAVTETGTGMPGTDRAWRAPPDDRRSVPWPDEYGLDHPS
ncbi:hypothetical protein ACFWMR_04295 [Amycolatopsis thailandensis]|uniref:hypothetical protein n=1 Tax=Amycolatopsis thailandensis TaxID=589330 RepID=UPI003653252B